MTKNSEFIFSRRLIRNVVNSIENIETIKIGEFYCPIPKTQKEYEIVMIGTMGIKVEVTYTFSELQSFVSYEIVLVTRLDQPC